MGRVINRGSGFLLRAATLSEFDLQPTIDPVINWFVSLISCLATKINPILERFTGHQFSVKTDTSDDISMDGDWLFYVAVAVVVALAAIPVVWLLWKVIYAVVWLLWKVISAVVSFLWNVIEEIFCCCCCCQRGKTMKAPGRDYRIYRNDFERNPANYFHNLHRDQRNWRRDQHTVILV